MSKHQLAQLNVATLKARGVEFVGPDAGLLSCGYEGTGRLSAIEQIGQHALKLLS